MVAQEMNLFFENLYTKAMKSGQGYAPGLSLTKQGDDPLFHFFRGLIGKANP